MCIEPYRRAPAAPAGSAASRPRPALLVHGFACNAAIWRPLLGKLRRAGYAPVRAASLSPICADLDSQAASLAQMLLALASECSGEGVTVIAHSMGGLAARAALRTLGPRVVRRIITIATPHRGTVLAAAAARWLACPPLEQMGPGSAWLLELNAAQDSRAAVPISCLYSLEDNLIAPAASAALEEARALEVPGHGHFSLLRSSAVNRYVLEALAEP